MASRKAISRVQAIGIILVVVIATVAGIWYYSQSGPETNPATFSMEVISRPFIPMKGEQEIPMAMVGQRVVFLVVAEDTGEGNGYGNAVDISATASGAAVSVNNQAIKPGEVAEVTVIPDQTSSPLAYYGVVCRYQDQDNYYFFEISYDGHYRIGKFWNGVFSLIGMGAAKTSSAINIGDYNDISATCVENELSLTINSTFIETVYDNTFTSGDTGLCASASNVPGIIAAFGYFIAEE